MPNQDDGLFLLEVLIDKIVFYKTPCFSDRDFKTCVTIDAPEVEPFEICDDDPGAPIAKSGGPFVKNFNNGKSCLFSLSSGAISKAMSRFEVKATVSKSLPCGCLPNKLVLGDTTINLTKEFIAARNKFLEDPAGVSYEALKDTFRLTSTVSDVKEVGEIVLFLRISCFGKLIITRFQGSGGPPHLSTAGSGVVDRSCNPAKKFQSRDDPCVCGAARGTGGSAGSGGGGGGGGIGGGSGGPCPEAREFYNSMPCEEPDDPCYCSGPKQQRPQTLACRNTEDYCLHVPKGRSKQYEEIGMNIAGNELKIKVPASAAIIKKISQTHCAMQCPFTKNKDEGVCDPPCGKNQISLSLPNEDVCCNGPQLADTQFTCTTEGCMQLSKHGPQAGLGRGDTKNQELPNVGVFVLKVAKTAVQGDRKCKMELELTTPKGPDKNTPIEKVSTRVQSEANCECCHRKYKRKGHKKHH